VFLTEQFYVLLHAVVALNAYFIFVTTLTTRVAPSLFFSHFPVLHFGASFSSFAFSTPCIFDRVFAANFNLANFSFAFLTPPLKVVIAAVVFRHLVANLFLATCKPTWRSAQIILSNDVNKKPSSLAAASTCYEFNLAIVAMTFW